MRALAAVGLVAAVVLGCAAPAATFGPQPTNKPVPTLQPTAAPTAVVTPGPTPIVSPIVGTWTRTIVCSESLAAFKAADLDDQIQAWVVGNFVGEAASPLPGHECDGARPPEQHSHFFTAAGAFGSLDANGQQVDNGGYALVDADTLSFASHAEEFGYDGDIPVDFKVDGDTATFTLAVPDPCDDACRVAYGWALSAFFGPDGWTRSP